MQMHLSREQTRRRIPIQAPIASARSEQTALETVVRLRRAVSAIQGRERRVIGEAGLTGSQFGVLETLHRFGPLCLKQLAARILKSTSNLTTVVDNLERRGLVERNRGLEDRREVTVWLTVQGRDLLLSLLPQYVASLMEALSVLTADEQNQLASLCGRLTR